MGSGDEYSDDGWWLGVVVGEWGRAWGGEVSAVDCDVGEVG